MSGIPAWAVRGAKVVAVGTGSAEPRYPGANYPDVGPQAIYTIRAVKPAGYGGCKETLVLLREIDNSHIKPEPFEPGYVLRAFRPLVSTKTEAEDLAHFRKLLDQPIPEAVE